MMVPALLIRASLLRLLTLARRVLDRRIDYGALFRRSGDALSEPELLFARGDSHLRQQQHRKQKHRLQFDLTVAVVST